VVENRKFWFSFLIFVLTVLSGLFAVIVLFALTNKQVRSRVVFHDVPESDIVDSVAEYGILRDMLPTLMGGTVELNMSEWIANRRAIEMEEL